MTSWGGLPAGPRIRPLTWIVVATVATLPALASATDDAAEEPAAPRLHVALEPEAVTVGDRVTAVLTLTVPDPGAFGEPRFPAWGGTWGEAEVVEVGPVRRMDAVGQSAGGPTGAVTWRQRIVLTAFRTGAIPLPARNVLLRDSGPTENGTTAGRRDDGLSPAPPLQLTTDDALTLTVRSVLPPGADPATEEPAPAAPLRRLPVGDAFWWTFGAALALLAGTLALLVARRPDAERESTPADPLAQLEGRLASLGPSTPIETGHVELSRALRVYLGHRLCFPAAESTTTEVHDRLRDHRHLPEDVVAPAVEILRACDRVKFAGEQPDAGVLAGRVEAVRRLARRLEEHLRPAWETLPGQEAA